MNKSDISRDAFMLTNKLGKKGYDWWWHSFTAVNRRTKQQKSFFIEFFLCNPFGGSKAPILGQSKENKENHSSPSYVMVKAGWWGEDAKQLHRYWGWKQVKVANHTPFYIKADNCYCSETMSFGKINVDTIFAQDHPEYMSDAGCMEWNIEIKKRIAFHVGYGANKFFRKLNAFEMFWHAEGMKTEYQGTIIANGEKYDVRPSCSYGYADKNWGKNFTSPWVWLSSNHLKSKMSGEVLQNSVFNIGGGRPKVFCIPLNRKLLSDFWYEGNDYEFNFSKFWTLTQTRFEFKEMNEKVIWHVVQWNNKYMMKTNIHCNKKEMLLLRYEDPQGEMKHKKLWNGGTGKGEVRLYQRNGLKWNLIDHIIAKHVGCEYGEF